MVFQVLLQCIDTLKFSVSGRQKYLLYLYIKVYKEKHWSDIIKRLSGVNVLEVKCTSLNTPVSPCNPTPPWLDIETPSKCVPPTQLEASLRETTELRISKWVG